MNIFISYRRDDSSGYAGRLYDRLAAHFGRPNVFMDIEALEPGVDFVEGIDEAMASCGALVVLIGSEWLPISDPQGRRRLDNPNDFIRLEIANALRRNLCVLPVLVNGAAMPTEEELPPELAPLARRQAQELSNTRWDYDVSRLIEALERWLAKAQQKTATDDVQQSERREPAGAGAQPQGQAQPGGGQGVPAWLWPAAAVLLLGVLGVGAVLWLRPSPSPPPAEKPVLHEQTSPEVISSGPRARQPPAAELPRLESTLDEAASPEPPPVGASSPDLPRSPSPAPPDSMSPEPQPIVTEPAPAPVVPPDPSVRIEALLQQAAADFEANRLTRPAGANAYLRYQEVLELSPDHPEALEGLRRLGYRYLELAAGALDQGRRDQASAYLEQAGRFIPDEPELAVLRERVVTPSPVTGPDPGIRQQCLQGCETALMACREEWQATNPVEACMAEHRQRCEDAFDACKSDPQKLFVLGELSTESACIGEHQQCTKRGEAECGQRQEVHMEGCEREAENCHRRCLEP